MLRNDATTPMLDAPLRLWIDRPLDAVGRRLAGAGISATSITVFGFMLGMAGCGLLAWQCYPAALVFILLNRAADGLDGAVARATQPSEVGAYLDIVLDFVFYSGVPFGFALGRPVVALEAAFLIYSFIGTGASFLAYSALAARRNLTTAARGRKSIYYAAGLAEGTETIVAMVLICLRPDWFGVIAWVFGALCWVTTAARIAEAVRVFRHPR